MTDTLTSTPTIEMVIQLTSGKTWSVKGPVDDEVINGFMQELTERLGDRRVGRVPGTVELVGPDGGRTIVAVAHVEGLIVYPVMYEPEQTG
jgi:hypothetical protein